MTDTYDLVITGGTLATVDGQQQTDIAIKDGQFAAIGSIEGNAKETLKADGLTILPGVIDTQVHFRELHSFPTRRSSDLGRASCRE